MRFRFCTRREHTGHACLASALAQHDMHALCPHGASNGFCIADLHTEHASGMVTTLRVTGAGCSAPAPGGRLAAVLTGCALADGCVYIPLCSCTGISGFATRLQPFTPVGATVCCRLGCWAGSEVARPEPHGGGSDRAEPASLLGCLAALWWGPCAGAGGRRSLPIDCWCRVGALPLASETGGAPSDPDLSAASRGITESRAAKSSGDSTL